MFNPHTKNYAIELRKNMAINVYKNQCWGSYRHLPLEELEDTPNEHCYVNQTTHGDLSCLRWMHGPLNSKQVAENFGYRLVNVSEHCTIILFYFICV